jgi:CCR4-NOT transcription complex subunit 4
MAPQDSFIDDEEDTWYVQQHRICRLRLLTCHSPLCIEELDIQDKNFYPCPCGYQVSVARQNLV